MLSWPSSQWIRYRGDGSPRTTSSTTPDRGRRSVDSDSATTRLPTSKAMLTPSLLVLAEHTRRGHRPPRPVADSTGQTSHDRVAAARAPVVRALRHRSQSAEQAGSVRPAGRLLSALAERPG